jgi:hypothetical protein
MISFSTVTVYACSSGVASPTVAPTASVGTVIAPTATYSPITYATGAASVNRGSAALGMIIAGGVALVSFSTDVSFESC